MPDSNMEHVYSKLYTKFDQLRRKKDSEVDQMSNEQELKFMNYVNIAEELVDQLRNEKDVLKARIEELTEEVISIRSEKESAYFKFEKLLDEETKKNKDLSEEVERLQNLQREGLCCSSKKRNNLQWDSPGGTQVGSKDTFEVSLRKKQRLQHVASPRDGDNQLFISTITEPERDSPRAAPLNDSGNIQQANVCMGNTATWGELNAYQILMECLVGMKFASVTEREGLCISALHQSSGYSFSLTWLSKAAEQAELLYSVASLGTFERVAPEWMKEDIVFSTSMCPMFFKRLSRVIGLHY